MPAKRRIERRINRPMKPKPPRLKLRISRGLEALRALPEGALSLPEQTILKRIDQILRGEMIGKLKETDFQNLLKIARKHRVQF